MAEGRGQGQTEWAQVPGSRTHPLPAGPPTHHLVMPEKGPGPPPIPCPACDEKVGRSEMVLADEEPSGEGLRDRDWGRRQAGLRSPRSSALGLPVPPPEAPPAPLLPRAPSPYQVPVAAREGAGHLPGAGSPGRGCQTVSGCKVSRGRHQVCGASIRQTELRCCPGPLGPPQRRDSAPDWESGLFWGHPLGLRSRGRGENCRTGLQRPSTTPGLPDTSRTGGYWERASKGWMFRRQAPSGGRGGGGDAAGVFNHQQQFREQKPLSED